MTIEPALSPDTRLRAVFYRASDGVEPVNDFINGLTERHQAAVDDQIERVNLLTVGHPHLPFPFGSQVEGEFRELRCHFGSTLYRILYRRSRQFVVLLHMFTKRTDTIPEGEKRISRDRWEDYRKRMNEQPRTPPRAIGQDAPPRRR
ncbi:MAG: hypothetical protein EPO26_15350 [Chloroflexota bacterium]|nr:MAG: hypothetical protein EPO26_15350 [Chloroflexota bacterium]